MKSTWKKLLALACIACMVMAQFAACAPTAAPAEETAQATTEPAAEATAAEPAAEDVYAISGTVSIAYPEGEVAEIQPVLDAFRAPGPDGGAHEMHRLDARSPQVGFQPQGKVPLAQHLAQQADAPAHTEGPQAVHPQGRMRPDAPHPARIFLC